MNMASLGGAENLTVDPAVSDGEKEHNDDHERHLSGGELSPRRRSTRVSAMRAAEKMKDEEPADYNDAQKREFGIEDADELVVNKKRRLAAHLGLDQWDSHFAIQLDVDDEVCALSDDSILSSLNEREIEKLTKDFQKNTSTELTDEQRRERLLMVRQLECELRLEEAKLLMLRKLRMSQQLPAAGKESTPSAAKSSGVLLKGTTSTGQQQQTTGVNGQHQQQRNTTAGGNAAVNMSMSHANRQFNQNAHRNSPQLAQQQQQQSHRSAGHAVNNSNNNSGAQQPTDLSTSSSRQQQQPTQRGSSSNLQSTPQSSSRAPPQQSAAQAQLDAQQRQMAVKMALRKQLEKTLLNIPTPKPLPEEPLFVPNLGQGDFVLYCGLDMAVQKVLKDKTFTDPKMKTPWTCEQCETDFTPYWKVVKRDAAGADEPSNWRTLCESCARSNQKKHVKADHTAKLKQTFIKALEQEKEIEQQIKDGKFDWSAIGMTPPTAVAAATSQQQSKQSATPPVQQQQQQQSQSQPRQQQSSRQQPSQHNQQQAQQQRQLAQAAAALQNAQRLQQQQANNPLTQAAQAQALLSQFALASMGAFNPAAALNRQFNPRDPAGQMAMLAAQAAQAQGNPFAGMFNNLPADLLRQLMQQQQQQMHLQQRQQGGHRK